MTTVRTKAEADQVRTHAYNLLNELKHERVTLKEQIKRVTKKQRARVKEIGLLIEQLCYAQFDTIHALQYSALYAEEQAEKETPCEAPEQPMISHAVQPRSMEWAERIYAQNEPDNEL